MGPIYDSKKTGDTRQSGKFFRNQCFLLKNSLILLFVLLLSGTSVLTSESNLSGADENTAQQSAFETGQSPSSAAENDLYNLSGSADVRPFMMDEDGIEDADLSSSSDVQQGSSKAVRRIGFGIISRPAKRLMAKNISDVETWALTAAWNKLADAAAVTGNVNEQKCEYPAETGIFPRQIVPGSSVSARDGPPA